MGIPLLLLDGMGLEMLGWEREEGEVAWREGCMVAVLVVMGVVVVIAMVVWVMWLLLLGGDVK